MSLRIRFSELDKLRYISTRPSSDKLLYCLYRLSARFIGLGVDGVDGLGLDDVEGLGVDGVVGRVEVIIISLSAVIVIFIK